MPSREVQIQKGILTSQKVYNAVSKEPGLSVYRYAKMLDFTPGRTHGAVKRLEEEGLVKTELRKGNPHNKRIVIPTSTVDLIKRFNRLDD